MGMNAALSISATEIDNINSQLALISHNLANAGTQDYAAESISQTAVTADGVGMGARDGAVQRTIDSQTQADLFAQNGTASSLATQQTALQQIDAAQGAVGSGTDIGSLLGALQDAFSSLAGSPDNQTQQQATVAAAQALATQINQVGNAVGTQRQAAQDAIVSGVAQLNSTLSTLGGLSDQIVAAQAAGRSTADLENQRDAAEDTLSQLVGVRFLDQPNGDLLVMTQSGISLPIHGTAAPVSTSPATLGASVYAPGGGVPAITLGGQDVTDQLTGGSLGANIQLRDRILPTLQASLDEFSDTLATRFQAQGLTLFTDAAGNVPSGEGFPAQSSYLGFSSEIQVNPAVSANPSLVRDGTNAVPGNRVGASAFTPNPAGGPAGFTALISRVLTYAFGSEVQAGVAQPPPNVIGLGPAGTLSAGFAAAADLTEFATDVTSAEAATSAGVTNQLSTSQGLQKTLQAQLASGSSVNMDAQMSQMIVLQNAYAANARVMSAVQSMWSQLTQAVQP